MMDADEDQFELDMDIMEALLSRPRTILWGKRILLDCVHDLFTQASKTSLLKRVLR